MHARVRVCMRGRSFKCLILKGTVVLRHLLVSKDIETSVMVTCWFKKQRSQAEFAQNRQTMRSNFVISVSLLAGNSCLKHNTTDGDLRWTSFFGIGKSTDQRLCWGIECAETGSEDETAY